MDETSAPAPPQRARFLGPQLPGVVPTIAVIICVIVFLAIQTSQGETVDRLQQWGWGPASAVWHGKVWLLVTSAFVHTQLWHLAFNVYWLWQLGQIVEQHLGRWKTVAFILGAAAFSSAAQLLIRDETGIGFSGVGYSLFGFLWVAKRHIPAVRERLTPQVIGIFVIWFFGCWIATLTNFWAVGNEAHTAGLALGLTLGAIRFDSRWRRPARAAIALMSALALGGLFYAPWSKSWTAVQGQRAWARRDFNAAQAWFRKSLADGQDPAWSWKWIAYADAYAGNQGAFRNDLDALRKVDPHGADEVLTQVRGSVSGESDDLGAKVVNTNGR